MSIFDSPFEEDTFTEYHVREIPGLTGRDKTYQVTPLVYHHSWFAVIFTVVVMSGLCWFFYNMACNYLADETISEVYKETLRTMVTIVEKVFGVFVFGVVVWLFLAFISWDHS